MATKIAWCDETINPIVGCSKISEACTNCYAEVMAARLATMPHTAARYAGVTANRQWTGKLNFVRSELEKPYKRKKPTRYFVGSMTDMFHPAVYHGWLGQIFSMMMRNPQHTFLLLTKRAETMFYELEGIDPALYPNVWLGVTVENQEQADARIPWLMKTPAAKRFISCEPLLGAIELGCDVDWVIAGCESGPKRRPTDIEWLKSLRDQCVGAVPFFLKQMDWGGELLREPFLETRQWLDVPK